MAEGDRRLGSEYPFDPYIVEVVQEMADYEGIDPDEVIARAGRLMVALDEAQALGTAVQVQGDEISVIQPSDFGPDDEPGINKWTTP